MPEYIDRNRLIEQLEEENDFYGIDSEYEWGQESQYKYDVKAIKEQPAADVVEVVRCKDCKYWQDNNGGYPHEECKWSENETPDLDDFCSYGERKDGDDND